MKKVDSYLVLLLAGKGERLSSAIKEKKQFYLVEGKPLFSYSLEVFKKTELFKKYIGPNVRIKAAGGVSTLEDLEMFINLGCERIGTSRAVGLCKGQATSGY